MATLDPHFQADVDAIESIPIVPKLLEVICRTTGMGFAAIARVTEEKWITCSVRDEILFGLTPGDELKVETTICHEIRQNGKAVVIDNVAKDVTFSTHHTPEMYGFKSYISVPILKLDGSFFGTLCAIDPKPAPINTLEITGMFALFAELIAFHLNAIEQLHLTENTLTEERKTAELREQFIAILGHDLLNPVGAALNAAQLLMRMPADERVNRLAKIIQDSSYRMKALIENILDFARGRMGEGIILNRQNEEITDTLNEVIAELKMVWPESIIQTNINIEDTIYCDSKRIAQLFSNLLGNALTHGKKDAVISVEAWVAAGDFMLSVTNTGSQIPATAMDRLFQPFSRGEVKKGQQGLGLGLYIASEIAGAHDGLIEVVTNAKETCFTLKIPA